MEKLVAKINADMFIIPNHACTINGFCCGQEKIQETANGILNYFGANLDSNEMYIETWMVAKNIECDNMADHGFIFNVGDQYYFSRPGNISRFVPKSAINIKEGEKTILMYRDIKVVPVGTLEDLSRARINRDADTVNVDLVVEVTANQHEYRYRNFGTFEQVLNRVCR